MTADDGPGLERQMGCMAGIFHHLFDRSSYIPSSQRFVSPKSLLLLPASDDAESVSPLEKSDASGVILAEQSANANANANADAVGKAVQQWKNLEASRLSLDSRAVMDAKGKLHRRSPGAVARLMGLEALPDQDVNSKPAHQLRRSSSDSRARNDPSFYQFVDATAFQKAPVKENATKQRSSHNSFIQRKSLELFPSEQPRRIAGAVQPVPLSLYCEIERRLRVRGIEEPAKDLETLKQVLDAVQLRGLLHSKPSDGYKEFLDSYHRSPGSPLVLMKPGSKPSRSPRRDPGSDMPQPQARRCTDRNRRVAKSEARRRTDRSKLSPIGSPVGSPRKVVPGPSTVRSGVNNTNNRRRDGNVAQRGISTGTGTGYNKRIKSPSAQYNWEEERTGQNILERCDELLYSIAAITATDQNSGEDPQPSPVSVLDSLFHADECSPPSPKSKRSLRFQDQLFDWAHEQSNDEMSTVGSDCSDPDYMFVAEIMRYSDRCRDLTQLFASLEKHFIFGGTDHASLHHHRLLYDLVCEMLSRRHHMLPWEAFKRTRSASSARLVQMLDAGDVWQQIQQMKEPIIANEVVTDVTSFAISKDLAADHTWSRQSVELSDAVLQIERMIFKDLVADSIKVLTDVASASYHHQPRRKLIF